MINPARITPDTTAMMLFLNLRSKIEAASVPVQAPVPGRGIPTKRKKAKFLPVLSGPDRLRGVRHEKKYILHIVGSICSYSLMKCA